jgi:hypothetical protein
MVSGSPVSERRDGARTVSTGRYHRPRWGLQKDVALFIIIILNIQQFALPLCRRKSVFIYSFYKSVLC